MNHKRKSEMPNSPRGFKGNMHTHKRYAKPAPVCETGKYQPAAVPVPAVNVR